MYVGKVKPVSQGWAKFYHFGIRCKILWPFSEGLFGICAKYLNLL